MKDIKRINRNFRLWCETFVKIVDNEGKQVPFKLNKQQQELHKNMGRYSCVLKARQLGCTTYSIAYCLWLICTRPNITTMILSTIWNLHQIF